MEVHKQSREQLKGIDDDLWLSMMYFGGPWENQSVICILQKFCSLIDPTISNPLI